MSMEQKHTTLLESMMKAFGVLNNYKQAKKEYARYVALQAGQTKTFFKPDSERLKAKCLKDAQLAYDSLDRLTAHFTKIFADAQRMSAEAGQQLDTMGNQAYLDTMKSYRAEMEIILNDLGGATHDRH